MEEIVNQSVQSQTSKKNKKSQSVQSQYVQPNRSERRKYLKEKSNYFKTKPTLNLKDWLELVISNIHNGKALQDARNKIDMENQEIFFKDRETKLIDIYKKQGLSKLEIDLKMDFWYKNI